MIFFYLFYLFLWIESLSSKGWQWDRFFFSKLTLPLIEYIWNLNKLVNDEFENFFKTWDEFGYYFVLLYLTLFKFSNEIRMKIILNKRDGVGMGTTHPNPHHYCPYFNLNGFLRMVGWGLIVIYLFMFYLLYEVRNFFLKKNKIK